MQHEEYASVVDLIRGLWKRYEWSDQLEAQTWEYLRGYSAEAITTALKRHHADEPDDPRPKWKTIMADLKTSRFTNAVNTPLQRLLTQTRNSLRDSIGQLKADAMTDEEVWRAHLWGAFRVGICCEPIRRNKDDGSRIMRSDPDGRLDKLYRSACASEARSMIDDHKKVGAEVPNYVAACVGSDGRG